VYVNNPNQFCSEFLFGWCSTPKLKQMQKRKSKQEKGQGFEKESKRQLSKIAP
jgi:hypothetical protein